MPISRIALLAVLLLAAVAHGAPSPELEGFWDAVYKDPPFEDSPKCSFDADGPASCKDRGEEGRVPSECLKSLSWEAPDTLICPNLCGNPSQIKIEHGVVKFDVMYVGPSPGGRHGDPDHFADRTREARHVELPLSRGKVSMNQYSNTKRYIETDVTIPLAAAIKGGHRDGAHVETVYFDRLRVKASLGDNAGKCDAGGNSTADSGRGGMLEVELLARTHDAGDSTNVGCQVFLYAPDYKHGQSCGREEPEVSSGGGDSGGHSSGGGSNRKCKSSCRDAAYQCRKSCRSDASCTRQCGDTEGSCLRGC